MKIQQLKNPLDTEGVVFFEKILSKIYSPTELGIRQTQPFGREHLTAAFVLTYPAREPLARIAIYDNPDLEFEGEKPLLFGAYEAINDPSVSAAILNAAFDFCKKNYPNRRTIFGSMDGSTWSNYRFVLREDSEAANPYFLEPFNKPYYAEQWANFGFTVAKSYQSNVAYFDESDRQPVAPFVQRFESKGIVFRNLDLDDIENELQRLAHFNLISFGEAFLYAPITEGSFVEKYRKIVPYLKPNIIWLALDGEAICGMIFTLHDYFDPTGKTAIVKTLARLPDEKYRGLGDVLCGLLVNSMLDVGYTKMIHALMRSDNASLSNSSRFWGEKFREYVLLKMNTEELP